MMARQVVFIEALDKPGILSVVTNTIHRMGGNIVTSVGYRLNGYSRLLLLIDSNVEETKLAETLEENLEDADVYVAEIGPAAASLVAEFIKERPGIVTVLEHYLDPPDLLDAIMRLPNDIRIKIYPMLSPHTLALFLAEAEEDLVKEIVESVNPKELARALEELDANEIADILPLLPEHMQRAILQSLPSEKRSEVAKLLKYPPESAGGIMTTSVLVLQKESTVQEALQKLLKSDYYVKDIVVVVDGPKRFYGIVPIDELLRAKPTEKLAKLARKPPVTVSPYEDQEEVAKIMLRYEIRRLPVVDDGGIFLGVIPIEDITYVLTEEAAEDVAKLGGLAEKPKERYLQASIRELVKLRIPWLFLIYIIESVTASILKQYEETIERIAVAAAFIPLIMDTGGNVGSQASSTIIRALALGEISERSRSDIVYTVLKELITATIIGVMFALIGLGFAYIMSNSIELAISISLTLFIVIVFSDLVGASLPIIARRLGFDPATLSAPFVTTVVDVSVAVIYMTLVSKLVLGL